MQLAARDGSVDDERGFTLIEIMIVLVIVAMGAALVGPSIEAGIRAQQVRTAARQIAGTMRTLQSNAVRTGKIQTLELDPVRNLYNFGQHGEPIALGDEIRIAGIRGGDYGWNGAVRVNFYANGSTSGLALLIGDRQASQDSGYVVRLDPLTGLVTVRDAGVR
jgi:general secretion pathway protein H